MDQTINGMVYSGRIKSTVRGWNEQLDGKTSGQGGSIIASDGTVYKKVDDRLVQVLDPRMKRIVRRLEAKLINDGLVEAPRMSAEAAAEAKVSSWVAEAEM